MDYKPPFTITNEIITYVSSISEKIGRITANSSLQREIQEVKNAYAAYDRLSEINPYSIKDLKRFHGIMTKYLVEESGSFRQGEEGVFNGDQCIFMAPPAQLVPKLMNDLFLWMKSARNRIHPLILGSVFHYEFVFIHPFTDGNGRMARLWHTAILSKWKPVFEYIPIESQIEKLQDEYYSTIARCHMDGESTVFIEFMLSQIDRILDDISAQFREDIGEAVTGQDTGQVADQVVGQVTLRELLDYCKLPRTRSELQDYCGLSGRSNFRENHLKPLLKSGLLKMTIPDKPNSKNQKYYSE